MHGCGRRAFGSETKRRLSDIRDSETVAHTASTRRVSIGIEGIAFDVLFLFI